MLYIRISPGNAKHVAFVSNAKKSTVFIWIGMLQKIEIPKIASNLHVNILLLWGSG
jgi:hypothetical protein